jgi:hypothetical protein
MNGIEAAALIRKTWRDTVIIGLSAMEMRALWKRL